MAQKVKVQDGVIVYEGPDLDNPVDFNVEGQANIRDTINIGNSELTDALITTGNGTPTDPVELAITSGEYGTINIFQNEIDGAILINNVQWPDYSVMPVPGMYIGASGVNTLTYYPFIIASVSDDNMTTLMLNNAFPAAQPGQYVASVNVVYMCVGPGQWRKIGCSVP